MENPSIATKLENEYRGYLQKLGVTVVKGYGLTDWDSMDNLQKEAYFRSAIRHCKRIISQRRGG